MRNGEKRKRKNAQIFLGKMNILYELTENVKNTIDNVQGNAYNRDNK